MIAEPITTVEKPCAACAHAEVCGIRPDIADWQVELPALHAAITARAVVTLDCRHFLPLQVLPAPGLREAAGTMVFELTPAGVRLAEELERTLAPEPQPAPEKPATEARQKAGSVAGRKSAEMRPVGSAWDAEEMFAAIRRHDRLAGAAAELGISSGTMNKRLTRLHELGRLPEDIAARRRADVGKPRPPREMTPEARERMREGAVKAGSANAAVRARIKPVHSQPKPSPVVDAVQDVRKRVVELPDREWPAPLPATAAAAVPDDFAERRAQAARDKAAAVWAERHPEGVAG